jgi:hypothetical protein
MGCHFLNSELIRGTVNFLTVTDTVKLFPSFVEGEFPCGAKKKRETQKSRSLNYYNLKKSFIRRQVWSYSQISHKIYFLFRAAGLYLYHISKKSTPCYIAGILCSGGNFRPDLFIFHKAGNISEAYYYVYRIYPPFFITEHNLK